MTKQELIDKRSKLMFDAHAIMTGANVTSEQRTAVDLMLAEANTLKADAERMAQFEASDAELRSVTGRIPQADPGASASADNRSPEQRRLATNVAMRSFLRGERFEQRDLTVAADGGVTIPVGVADPKVAQKSVGYIYDLVTKLKTDTGEAIKVPLLNDTGNGFVLNSTVISVTDPSVAGVTISIDDARSNPILIENSLLRDVGFDLVGFVEKATQIRYMRTASNWITNGNGSNVGALTGITAGITGATTLVLTYKDLSNLKNALDAAYQVGAVWVYNQATQALIEEIVDTNGRPIFMNFNDGATSGYAGTLFGYPVRISPFHPSIGVGSQFIQFGKFDEAYTFREVNPGVVLKRTDERYIELNKVGFISFARCGGAVTDGGTHPVVTLTGK